MGVQQSVLQSVLLGGGGGVYSITVVCPTVCSARRGTAVCPTVFCWGVQQSVLLEDTAVCPAVCSVGGNSGSAKSLGPATGLNTRKSILKRQISRGDVCAPSHSCFQLAGLLLLAQSIVNPSGTASVRVL